MVVEGLGRRVLVEGRGGKQDGMCGEEKNRLPRVLLDV